MLRAFEAFLKSRYREGVFSETCPLSMSSIILLVRENPTNVGCIIFHHPPSFVVDAELPKGQRCLLRRSSCGSRPFGFSNRTPSPLGLRQHNRHLRRLLSGLHSQGEISKDRNRGTDSLFALLAGIRSS